MRSLFTLASVFWALTSLGCASPTPTEVFEGRARGQWLLQFVVEAEAGSVYVDDHATWDTPSFRNGSCLEIDLYQVAAGAEEMFPASSEGDRCDTRPTATDPSRPYRLITRDPA